MFGRIMEHYGNREFVKTGNLVNGGKAAADNLPGYATRLSR